MEQNIKDEVDYYQRLKGEINTLELKRSQLETEINLPTTIDSLKKEVSILQGAKRQLDLDIDSLKREKKRGVEIQLLRQTKELQAEINRLLYAKKALMKDYCEKRKLEDAYLDQTRKEICKASERLGTLRETFWDLQTAVSKLKDKEKCSNEGIFKAHAELKEKENNFNLRLSTLTERENKIVPLEKKVQDKTRLLSTEINIKLQAIRDDENKVKELHAKNLDEITTARNVLNAGQTKLQTNIIAVDERTSAIDKLVERLDEGTKKLEAEKVALKTNKELFYKEKQDYEWNKNKLQ